MRLCENIVKIKEKLDNGISLKNSDSKILYMILTRHDTWKMRGIHLSSLMFWQDYIKDKKLIQTFDI